MIARYRRWKLRRPLYPHQMTRPFDHLITGEYLWQKQP